MFGINQNYTHETIDGELIRKAKKTCDKITETIYLTTNEPTLALYRIQEHIQRSLPIMIQKKNESLHNESILKGLLYDIEYTNESIDSIRKSQQSFETIQSLLKKSIYLKQQYDYEENVKRRVKEKLKQQQQQQLVNNDQIKDNVDPLIKQEQSSTKTTATRRIRISSSSSSSNSNNRFNRFSTSFDFSQSLPISVASSVSADIRSLINQFTNKDSMNIQPKQQNSVEDNVKNTPANTSVTSSKSLYTLPEAINDNPPPTTSPTSMEDDSMVNHDKSVIND